MLLAMENSSHKSSLSLSPFLHVVLRRSEYETWPEFKQIPCSRSIKGEQQPDFVRYSLQKSETNSVATAISAKNNASTVSRQQLPAGKQAISNRSVEGVMKDQRSHSLPLSSSSQLHLEKSNRVSGKEYVFHQVSSLASHSIGCLRRRPFICSLEFFLLSESCPPQAWFSNPFLTEASSAIIMALRSARQKSNDLSRRMPEFACHR